MTTNPQTQKNFFSKVSHFSHFPGIPTFNLKPNFSAKHHNDFSDRRELSTLYSALSTLPSPLEFLSPENNCPL